MLNPIKVFEGSFGGETLWENPNYITPNAVSTFEKKCKTNNIIVKRSKTI